MRPELQGSVAPLVTSKQRSKDAIRQEARSLRKKIPAVHWEQAAHLIAQNAASLLELLPRPAHGGEPPVVGLYHASPVLFELPTQPLDQWLRAQGYRVAYPRIIGATGEAQSLEFFEADPLLSAHWVPGAGRILEPRSDLPRIPPSQLALVLVPGLAFDLDSGARIGYGKGHYDRWFSQPEVNGQRLLLRVGLALSEQTLFHWTPDDWDQPMDAVLTPQGLVRPKSSRK